MARTIDVPLSKFLAAVMASAEKNLPIHHHRDTILMNGQIFLRAQHSHSTHTQPRVWRDFILASRFGALLVVTTNNIIALRRMQVYERAEG
jgi:hypothetical protein